VENQWGEPLIGAIPLQSTGCRDRKGVEIFEGDVLAVDIEKFYGIVRFVDAMFCIDTRSTCLSQHRIPLVKAMQSEPCKSAEIVGNVFQHSHLF
jgi:hypothetical protein